jgi:hypothetical protein
MFSLPNGEDLYRGPVPKQPPTSASTRRSDIAGAADIVWFPLTPTTG